MAERSKNTALAAGTASRAATSRGRPPGGARRKRSGSLVLTALVVVGALVGMLVLMVKVAP